MSIIRIKDKTFKTSITEAEIKARIKVLAQQINKDMEGKTPLFLGVLNGAFIFAADLMREMTIPCEISFVKLASYQGTTSTGKIQEVLGINEDLSGRHVCGKNWILTMWHSVFLMTSSWATVWITTIRDVS